MFRRRRSKVEVVQRKKKKRKVEVVQQLTAKKAKKLKVKVKGLKV